MGQRTTIAWADATWNPVVGCSKVSAGCRSCWAERMAARLSAPRKDGKRAPYEGLGVIETRITRDGCGPSRWSGRTALIERALDWPLRKRKPLRIAVGLMGDIGHESRSCQEIGSVFAVMEAAQQHTFYVLTKRAERMARWVQWWLRPRDLGGAGHHVNGMPPNVWLGVSVEDQASLSRIDDLLQTPAAHRFVSFEPLLEGIDAREHLQRKRYWNPLSQLWTNEPESTLPPYPVISAVIIGGESGPGARLCRIEWVRDLVAQCEAAGTPVQIKQLGANVIDGPEPPRRVQWPGDTECRYPRMLLRDSHGADPSEWPDDLRAYTGRAM